MDLLYVCWGESLWSVHCQQTHWNARLKKCDEIKLSSWLHLSEKENTFECIFPEHHLVKKQMKLWSLTFVIILEQKHWDLGHNIVWICGSLQYETCAHAAVLRTYNHLTCFVLLVEYICIIWYRNHNVTSMCWVYGVY